MTRGRLWSMRDRNVGTEINKALAAYADRNLVFEAVSMHTSDRKRLTGEAPLRVIVDPSTPPGHLFFIEAQ